MKLSFIFIISTLLLLANNLFGITPRNVLTIPVELYVLEDSEWAASEVKEKLQEASSIMLQCGLKISVKTNITLIKGTLSDGTVKVLSDLNKDFYKDEVKLHKRIGSKNGSAVNRIIFVRKVVNLPGVLGISRRTALHKGSVFENAIYISNQLGTSRSGHTIAHELGHNLLNEGHYREVPPNIMHYDYTRQNYEFETTQCQKMRNSLLVEKN